MNFWEFLSSLGFCGWCGVMVLSSMGAWVAVVVACAAVDCVNASRKKS